MARPGRTGCQDGIGRIGGSPVRGRQVRAVVPGVRGRAPGSPHEGVQPRFRRPIRKRCGVQNPDVVAVIDPTLLESVRPTEGCTEKTVYLVNTPATPAEIKARLNLPDTVKVITIDATKITLEEFGQNRPNAPMLGTFAHVFDEVPIEAFVEHFSHKMAKLPEKILAANVRAIRRGYEEVQVG